MAGSVGRKTVGVSRGLMTLCETCYAQVIADKLTDEKNFVTVADTLFDTICCGCTDINRPPYRRYGGERGVMGYGEASFVKRRDGEWQ